MIKLIYRLAGLSLLLTIGPTSVDAAGGVLIYRYGWAPLFCYSGSNTGVPREYCGLNPPALTRFTTHRALRIVYSSADGTEGEECPDPTTGYSSSALSPSVRSALHCIGNSYTLGNDDGWWTYLWKASGTCAAKSANLSVAQYFKLMADAFAKYDVDSALKSAGLNFSSPGTVEGTKVLDVLEKAFGQRGFYTCDQGTRSKYSTFSICLTLNAPYNITKCPAKYLKPNTKCPQSLKIVTENSGPVSASCLKYYPAFKN